jgi:hypothetical protein
MPGNRICERADGVQHRKRRANFRPLPPDPQAFKKRAGEVPLLRPQEQSTKP